MNHITSIGLDVHARSVTAAAFNPATGEVTTRKFGNNPAELAEWILSFESPKAVYESGVTGFHLVRVLRSLGIDCIVGAVSKMMKPAADKARKNDRNDSVFLARMLAAHNIVEVMVPDEECEAMRDLSRLLEDAREDLARAKHRLTKFLLRHGYVFDEKNADGRLKNNWTHAHWEWMRKIEFEQSADRDAYDAYISQVRHLEKHKKMIEGWVVKRASEKRWQGRVEALRCLKGIDTITAFAIVVEAQVFSRFDNASAFEAWLGLVPSEHSSGESNRKGGITKSGNSHLRKLFVEASWHYANALPKRKERRNGPDVVPLAIENHAAKGTKRLVERRRHLHSKGKKPVVANVATARELAGWCWAIGRMCEGTL